jgi:hypothetical protein
MKRGRTALIVALVCAMLATGGVQSLTQWQRHRLIKGNSSQPGTSLAGMDSFALALLLGGLRGPLVMFLWMQSESTKKTRDLEGVETQIEWIRLLQPEFDTVHLFQIWNKAYNLSAQLAGEAGKYLVILDALEYANSVDRQRPDSISIISAIGGIYNEKLAGSQDKAYFTRRVRAETKWRPPDPPRVAGSRPMRLASMLNEDGTIRSQYLEPEVSLRAKPTTSAAEVYDGSALQFLKRYQPFPYGLSPRALGYNYLKRSQVLQSTTGQRHIQVGPMVIDSRPSLCLRQWSEDEWNRGIAAEARLLGITLPPGRLDGIVAGGKANPLALGAEQVRSHEADLQEAIASYTLSLTLMRDSLTEFQRHLANPDYQMHVEMYASHLDHLAGASHLVQGDLDLLKALTAEPAEKLRLLADAREQYTQARRRFRIICLKYYSDRRSFIGLVPQGSNLTIFESLSDEKLDELMKAVITTIDERGYDSYEADIHEYDSYRERALSRLKMLGN